MFEFIFRNKCARKKCMPYFVGSCATFKLIMSAFSYTNYKMSNSRLINDYEKFLCKLKTNICATSFSYVCKMLYVIS
jgi:hypothetical protein